MSEDLADAGGAVTTGLIPREIDRAHADAPAVGHREDESCANCGTVRQGPYCHRCGQSGHVHRTAGALVHDIAHGVFHFEGRIWHTLPLLALRPGELTRRYVHGERARFVSPMALFLFSVFLMFAVVSSLAGPVNVNLPTDTPKVMAEAAREMAQAEARVASLQAARATAASVAARKAIDDQLERARAEVTVRKLVAARVANGASGESVALPEDLKLHTGWHRLDEAVAHAARNPDLLLYKMKSYGYKYSWALIPISLPFLWLLFAGRRDVGFYDHAIFAIFSLSFMSLGVVALSALGWIGVPSAPLVIAALIVPPVHMYRQLKGAYRLSRFGAGWRTVALLAIVTVTSLLFAAFLFYLGTE